MIKYISLLAVSVIGIVIFVESEVKASPISNGYGDFVFTFKGNEKPNLTSQACHKVYTILSLHTIQHYVDSGVKVQELDSLIRDTYPSLKVNLEQALKKQVGLTFIPRTLYELMYINRYVEQSISEDFKTKGLTSINPLELQDRLDTTDRVNGRDWDAEKLTCQMLDVVSEYIQSAHVTPDPSGMLSSEDLIKLLNDQFTRLEKSYHLSLSKSEQLKGDIKLLFDRLLGSSESSISFERAKLIMTNAVMAEIDPKSIGSFLVYRPNSHVTPDALVLDRFPASFMTSLFSGMHDPHGNTTAIYFMHPHAEGYVFRVPLSRMTRENRTLCPLHISLGNTVRQMAATNQPSHNWLKGPQSLFRDIARMEGVDAEIHFKDPNHLWHYIGIPKSLKSKIPDMQAEFDNYYDHRIILVPREP